MRCRTNGDQRVSYHPAGYFTLILLTFSDYNNEMHTNKWVPVAKQAITELNMSTNFQYEPIWSEGRKHHAMEFLQKIAAAKNVAEANVEEWNRRIHEQNQGTSLFAFF